MSKDYNRLSLLDFLAKMTGYRIFTNEAGTSRVRLRIKGAVDGLKELFFIPLTTHDPHHDLTNYHPDQIIRVPAIGGTTTEQKALAELLAVDEDRPQFTIAPEGASEWGPNFTVKAQPQELSTLSFHEIMLRTDADYAEFHRRIAQAKRNKKAHKPIEVELREHMAKRLKGGAA